MRAAASRVVSVSVPATSANLGPGFDSLGVALELRNTVRAEPAARVEVVVEGEGAGRLPTGPENRVYQALARAFAARGRPAPALRLVCVNRIPLARGLGSSAAAAVAGLALGNRLLGDPLSADELLALATEIEGHPDNVTPCLLGGLRAMATENGRVLHCAVPTPAELAAVAFIPDFQLDTARARAVLPTRVPFGDAVWNVSRTGLLVAALAAGRLDLLRAATADRLHQPYRQTLFPALPALVGAALEAGALGAFLSGAGPTVLALVAGRGGPVASALAETGRRHGVAGRTAEVALAAVGCQVAEAADALSAG